MSNEKYAKLVHVSVNGLTSNSNKVYIMTQIGDTIKCEYGRVGRPLTTITKPMSKWNSIYLEKINKKGYMDVTHLLTERVVGENEVNQQEEIANITDEEVRLVIGKLIEYANATISENYTVSTQNVTKKQVDSAIELLDNVTNMVRIGVNIKEVNDLLMELYMVIPRQMKNVNDYLISAINNDTELQRVLEFLNKEKSTLDVMAGQVALNEAKEKLNDSPSTNISVLDRIGVTMEVITDEGEFEAIRKFAGIHANNVHRIFKVTNHLTEKVFNDTLALATDKYCELLFHGSRNQNWFNIIQSGLLIRPTGAGYNGSMWDKQGGIYFANDSDKSMGYTDSGRWIKGNAQKFCYLALYQVHLGKQLHFYEHTNEARLLTKEYLANKGGYNSTYAHKGRSLFRDEFIVYTSTQSTIKYLFEFKVK